MSNKFSAMSLNERGILQSACLYIIVNDFRINLQHNKIYLDNVQPNIV